MGTCASAPAAAADEALVETRASVAAELAPLHEATLATQRDELERLLATQRDEFERKLAAAEAAAREATKSKEAAWTELERMRSELPAAHERDAGHGIMQHVAEMSVRISRLMAPALQQTVIPPAAPSNERATQPAQVTDKDAEITRLRDDNARKDAEIASKDAEIATLRRKLLRSSAAGAGAAGAPPETSAVTDEELEAATAQVELEQQEGKCTFWFVKADAIRGSDETTLPSFRALRERGQLEQRTISRSDAFRGVHRRELLAISHRWESPEAPDGLGVQMGALRKRLAERQEIELVWYDYWCMAQDERSAEERQTGRRGDTRSPAAIALFKHMLKNVNLLYLGCSVLCLVDISYLSRFWVRDRR